MDDRDHKSKIKMVIFENILRKHGKRLSGYSMNIFLVFRISLKILSLSRLFENFPIPTNGTETIFYGESGHR